MLRLLIQGNDMFLDVSYEDALRDGVLLCKLMNKLQPGLITKINTSGGDYKMMDNLNQYVSQEMLLYRMNT